SESAAHGTGRRNDRGAPGSADPDSWEDESRGRGGAGATESALPVCGWDDSGVPYGAADGTYLPQPDAHGAFLSSAGDCGAAGAGGDGARQPVPLGGHHGGGCVQCLRTADELDSAAVPGTAQTGSG